MAEERVRAEFGLIKAWGLHWFGGFFHGLLRV
jgi:hypothetical protein